MQSVYALLQSKSDDLDKESQFLYDSIDRVFDLYAIVLSLLTEVCKMEKTHQSLSKKKILASPEELNPNTKFINNRIFKILLESPSLKDRIESRKLNCWYLDNDYVKKILKRIKADLAYKDYMQSPESDFREDREFVLNIFKHIIAPNDTLADYFEDSVISWADDIPFVNTWIVKTLNQLKPGKGFKLGRLYKDDDDKKFVSELFRKTVLNHHKYEEEIVQKTPNWDKERIAEVDMILLKMALCEFLCFPLIPTRVTINEYIEISKDYSTVKSSFFINGVLDKLLKEYTETKRLQKIGRGLL
jgi:N utilization substance protein B